MPTRAAAKAEAAFLKTSGAATLSSPPSIPAVIKSKGAVRVVSGGAKREANISTVEQQATPARGASAKRKHSASKIKKTAEPVVGGWDILPHGLGKKGDIIGEYASEQQNVHKCTPSPKKRAKRGKVLVEIDDRGKAMLNDDEVKIKKENSENNPKSALHNESNDGDGVNIEVGPKFQTRRGNAKNSDQVMTEASTTSVDPVTAELLEDYQSKNRERAANIKTEIHDADMRDPDFEDQKPKKNRVSRNKKSLDASQEVLDKVDSLISASGNVPKKERKKKANKYGLTPGYSPFPEFVMPTPEACEEVTRLLSELHGQVKPPDVIPPPSMEVTGCGEVPDLLDAILRTLLSASTTARNSNMALKGLKDRFGLRTSGLGEGSVNWEAVHRAELPTIIESIKKGGLAKVKGTNIKKILDAVYGENIRRRDALVAEKATGKPATTSGAKQATQEHKDLEITKADPNMLSMDYIFEMTTEEAMDEMTKLPGIGVKTASCVILFCMKRPSFAVDTHVWRHCKWLGWVPEKATRDQTFSHCEVRIPAHLKYPLHQLFLRHGKTCGRCRANTSAGTEEWEKTICPIDHLVTRNEKKKMPGAARGLVKKANTTGRKQGGKGRKRKDDDESEESVEEGLSDHYDDDDHDDDNEKEEDEEDVADDSE